MEWKAIEAGWDQVYKGNAQRRFNRLSREQVEATKANRAALVAQVQAAYGLSAEKAEAQVADWQSRQREIRMLFGERW